MQPGTHSIRRFTSWQLIGAQLRHFRKLAGLTQAALATQLGVGEDTIASIAGTAGAPTRLGRPAR
ncbi:helix-turn-helix domain-containing protein [Streptomyces globisporus]|uniref:helix-turn-helix domain-containing protein n=1 Tax=Streptomyces globisporus TaxID=1908 RepID=UPI00379FF8EA